MYILVCDFVFISFCLCMILMKEEGRARKFGRFEATFLRYIFQTIPEDRRDDYRARFLNEYAQYSDMPKKEDEPENEGCVRELNGLDDLDVLVPE